MGTVSLTHFKERYCTEYFHFYIVLYSRNSVMRSEIICYSTLKTARYIRVYTNLKDGQRLSQFHDQTLLLLEKQRKVLLEKERKKERKVLLEKERKKERCYWRSFIFTLAGSTNSNCANIRYMKSALLYVVSSTFVLIRTESICTGNVLEL